MFIGLTHTLVWSHSIGLICSYVPIHIRLFTGKVQSSQLNVFLECFYCKQRTFLYISKISFFFILYIISIHPIFSAMSNIYFVDPVGLEPTTP